MRFADVDNEERYLIAKAGVQGFEVPSLGAERGSGEAAKNQRDRFVIAK
jgi:hypothetical protein